PPSASSSFGPFAPRGAAPDREGVLWPGLSAALSAALAAPGEMLPASAPRGAVPEGVFWPGLPPALSAAPELARSPSREPLGGPSAAEVADLLFATFGPGLPEEPLGDELAGA